MVSPLPSEPELLKRCAQGDTEEFGRLVTHYQDAIFNLVFRMIGNREDARDVTQEVFIKAFRRIRSFEGRSSFGTWLYSIAVNQSISERRRRSATSRAGQIQMSLLAGEKTESGYDPPGNGPAPDDYSSISNVLGCSRGTVKSRLHRARLELRRKLQGLLIA